MQACGYVRRDKVKGPPCGPETCGSQRMDTAWEDFLVVDLCTELSLTGTGKFVGSARNTGI